MREKERMSASASAFDQLEDFDSVSVASRRTNERRKDKKDLQGQGKTQNPRRRPCRSPVTGTGIESGCRPAPWRRAAGGRSEWPSFAFFVFSVCRCDVLCCVVIVVEEKRREDRGWRCCWMEKGREGNGLLFI